MKITSRKLKRLVREALNDILEQTPEDPKVTTGKFGNRKLQIINAWNGHKTNQDKESMRALIKVLKQWNVEKEIAMQILKSKDGDEVKALADNL